eukprot:6492754-Amphidinium_carterae.2
MKHKWCCCLEAFYPQPPDQEPVQRLKGAEGKTNQTILAAVSSSLASSPWWSIRMKDFMTTAPSMAHLAPKLKEYEEVLQSLPLVVGSVEKLIGMVVDIPDIKRQLRHGSCDNLMDQLEKKLNEMWLALKPTATGLSKSQLASVAKLFQECCSLYPLQSGFHEALEACGQYQKQVGQQEVMQLLVKEAGEVLEHLDMEKEDAAVKIKVFSEHVATSAARHSGLSGEAKDLFKQVFLALGGFLAKTWTLENGAPEFVHTSLEVLKQLAHMMNEPDMIKEMLCLEEGMVAVFAHVDLAALACKNVDDTKALEITLLVQRRHMKFMQTVKAMEVKDNDMLKKLVQFMPTVQAATSAQVAQLTQTVVAGLQLQKKALSKLAGGGPDGQSWLQDFVGTTWESLVAQAQNTLAKVDSKDLVEKQKSLKEVTFVVPATGLEIHTMLARLCQLLLSTCSAKVMTVFLTRASDMCFHAVCCTSTPGLLVPMPLTSEQEDVWN